MSVWRLGGCWGKQVARTEGTKMSSTPSDGAPAGRTNKWRYVRDLVRSIMNDPAPGPAWWPLYAERWVPEVVRAVIPPPANQRKVRLQAEGVLSRDQLRAFFAASWRAFDRPDFQQHLRDAASRGEGLSRLVNELQRQIFEALGIHGKFGLAFLSRLREVYGNDSEFMQEVLAFVDREQRALDEAGAIGYAVD